MGAIPGWMLRHTITVEAYLGETGTGPSYAAAVTVPCFVDAKVRTVLAPDGTEVVSTSTVYCRTTAAIPAGSRVTIGGVTSKVIDVATRDGGGFPTFDHLEVVCQ